MTRLDVGIVGSGIVGLAHAWSAAERGHRVTLYERTRRAEGASVRNFGMVWPIGQPTAERQEIAVLSRQRWLELSEAAGIWVRGCGSLHLAHRADEWSVLQEFAAHPLGADCQLWTPHEVHARTPAAHPDGLLGGLYSPLELCVDPREAVRRLPQWLADTFDVRLEMEEMVVDLASADGGPISLRTSSGRRQTFDRVVVCGGSELRTLFPEVLAAAGLRLCKLQMLRTVPQPAGWQLGPHLASGLTLRHYRNFDVCPSLPAVRERIAREASELDQFGIHVMVSQNERGELTLGDSHEYGDVIEPFDRALIEELILREIGRVFRFPDPRIAERWHGTYVRLDEGPWFLAEPLPGVFVCTGTGGAGMTMSFGLAERTWEQWPR
jgi:FAD dependent oxidoreductase TIGR03364